MLALVLVAVMALAMGTTAWAAEGNEGDSSSDTGATSETTKDVAYTGTDGDNATITISNASRGETYTVVKLFDATVTGTEGGPIAYQGDIPESLGTYFTKNATTGAITATEAAKSGDSLSEAAATALKTWASSQTATASADADGTILKFTGLPYGYYVVLTTQGTGTVTVTNTNPHATVVDKNTTEPTIQKKVEDASGDWVEVTDANIGEEKVFKIDINTANWYTPVGGTEQKQVKEYIIGEDFDTNKFTLVSIDSIQVINVSTTMDEEGNTSTNETVQETLAVAENATFPQTVTWVDGTTSKYPNGAIIRVVYKAKLNDDALVDVGNESEDLRGNVNTADLNWNYTDNATHFGEGQDKLTDTAAVDTYAIALKKFDKSGNALSGAKFQFPFYVKSTADSNGNYVYAGTTAGEGLTNEIVTPTDGQITVVGVKAGTYSITETESPNGYNKLAAPISITATKISTTTTTTTTAKTWKIDDSGNVYDEDTTETTTSQTTYTNNTVAATTYGVINLAGSTLPSTGGIGTTIFYVIGAILVIGAGIILVTRKRMGNAK